MKVKKLFEGELNQQVWALEKKIEILEQGIKNAERMGIDYSDNQEEIEKHKNKIKELKNEFRLKEIERIRNKK
jgi:hypothetical protein